MTALFFFVILFLLHTAVSDSIEIYEQSIDSSSLIADRVNEFGYTLLLHLMKEDPINNVVLSPTSVSGLLAMILLGSVGKTHEELAVTLGFSHDVLDNRRKHEEFGELLRSLSSNTSSQTIYANAIVADAHTKLRPLYTDYLRRVYNGDVFVTDFSKLVESKLFVNDWVKNKTGGEIEEFLQQPLPQDTKAVLLSALYFKGQWENPFIPEYTKKMEFKTPSANILTDLMYNSGQYDYIFSPEYGLHMIALPYNDTKTVMYALKPFFPERLSLTDLMKKLDYHIIDNLINRMTAKKTVVRFPKMEVKSDLQLEAYLKGLGINNLFDPSAANLALMVDGIGMNDKPVNTDSRTTNDNNGSDGTQYLVNSLPNPGVYVDKIIHTVKIKVNEYGTEAVAATGGILSRSAELFYANSPFYIFIRDERTKLVTFSAIINEPTS